MKLIDEITIKADCVEFFLRDLCKKYKQGTFIVDVIMQPHKYQGIFDQWRIDNEYEEKPKMMNDDEIFELFCEKATTFDFRQVADNYCSTCGGDGIYTDSQDDYSNGFHNTYEFPAICCCIHKNGDQAVKYWISQMGGSNG